MLRRLDRWVLLGFLLGPLAGCGWNEARGGNSAETGNPEIAGVLRLSDQTYASKTEVFCVPQGFQPQTDSLESRFKTQTDSVGAFHFDSLPVGYCAIEALHTASGERLLTGKLEMKSNGRFFLEKTLYPAGRLRIGLTGVANGEQVTAYVPGTTILRNVIVKFHSIFLDSLPSSMLDSLVILLSDGDSVVIDRSIQVASGQLNALENPEPITSSLKIPLITTAQGSNLKDTLFGFPLAIRLDQTHLDFDAVQPETPLHITGSDSTKALAYRVSYWDRATERAVIWVRMDTLLPQSSTQAIHLQWDESSMADTTIGQPFSNQDGYLAAWHFDEGPGKFLDASENAYDGEPLSVAEDTGCVGVGYRFESNKSHVHIPGSMAGLLDFSFEDTMSISIWVNLQATNTSRFIYGKGTYQYHLKFQYPTGWHFNNHDESPVSRHYVVESIQDTAIISKNWRMLTVVKQGSTFALWENDSLLDSMANSGVDANMLYRGSPLEIGHRIFPDGFYDQTFKGLMDEMSISNRARSPEWIRMTALNQHPVMNWP